MKTTLNKSVKRVLSLCLAIVVAIGSLFVANVGVNINASASSQKTLTDTWDGGYTALTDSDLDDAGNYIISTVEQLAWVALKAGDATVGKVYKVADNIRAFYINEGYDNSSFERLKATLSTGRAWGSTDKSASFQGTFDGNGVVIYGLYTSGNNTAGLFPWVKGAVSFKNVAVTDSYISGVRCVGAIVGADGVGWNQNTDSISFDNCSVTNNYLVLTSVDVNLGWGNIGGLAGCIYQVDYDKSLTINNCIILNNHVENANSANFEFNSFIGGFNRGGTQVNGSYVFPLTTYSNCITDARAYSAANDAYVDKVERYSNIYTTADFTKCVFYSQITENNIKLVTADDLIGTDIVDIMPNLDWSGTWFANNSYPVLRAFHNINSENLGNGTHSEECLDCEIVGVVAEHYYNTVDKVYNQSVCACGARIDGIFDVWDSEGAKATSFARGSGTENDPYIIETVEQLFKMVCEAGEDADGNPQYYKVADGVTALYINDTRGYSSQKEFEASAVADTLYNWSEKIPTGFCAGGCTHTKPATLMLFNGYFDGNGATIYGLYSKTSNTNSWVNGTGFVPGMVRNSVIKNVVFDTSYVKSSAESAAVVCSSFGLSSAEGHVKAGYCCSDYEEMLIYKATPSLINIAVRNAYVQSKNSMGDGFDTNGDGVIDDWSTGAYSFSAGITANYAAPKSLTIQHCLFDGTNSTLVSDIGTGVTINGVQVPIVTTSAGIFASIANWAYTYADSCVSIGADVSNKAENINIQNSYTTVAGATSGAFVTTDYATVNGLPLLNWTAWNFDAVTTYGMPMPKLVDGWDVKNFRYYKDAFKNSVMYEYSSGAGLYPYGASKTSDNKGYVAGAFSNYDELIGAGTEADPYIIDNAQTLFEIIASGGMHLGVPLYFKLACDIDLEGIQWVCHQTESDTQPMVYYIYNEFGGIIDGDGHTITGMYTGTTDTAAGFIPELASTGVVKNLHFRNSYAYTTGGTYAVIAGKTASGSKIVGCSVDSGVADNLVGDSNATVTNSYAGENATVTNDALFDGTNYDTAVWYKGGAEGSKYLLLNKALAMPYADIDGDGEGYDYGAEDISALKNKLLRKSEYANIYGDVSRNGKTDIRDLVILQREIDPDDLIVELDGFWKNVKAGNFEIWYDENDNYDAARKLQLYLQEATGVDIAKNKGAGDGKLDIVIKNNAGLAATKFSVAYDLENAVLTISGGSFTAIEQAVIEFINGSNASVGSVYTVTAADVPSYKAAMVVETYSTNNDNGSLTNNSGKTNKGTYYYVWGDEFDQANDGTISYDKWGVRDKGGDTIVDATSSGEFANIKLANNQGLKLLNKVENGRLIMRRGVGDLSPQKAGYNSEPSYTSDPITADPIPFDSNDMASSGIINTSDSLLFKRGYMEMQATLPNDKNAFPAWWLLSKAGNNNLDIERSLYSKVYPVNEYYSESRPLHFSSADATTYQYKLPTYTYEIDLFEIINNSTQKNKIYYNLHKWYTYSKSTHISTESFDLFDLNWSEITANNTTFSKKLLSTTYNGTKHVVDSASIFYHAKNVESGQVNVAINEFGSKNTYTGKKYGKEDGAELEWWQEMLGYEKEDYDVNMITNISGSSVTYKFGFLWTEDEMTYILKDTNGNLKYSITVDLDDIVFDKNTRVLPEQYVYFLIDNHFYTNGSTNISVGDMTVEYVRLYQLDGQRDIVTPETEAFNSDYRFGN